MSKVPGTHPQWSNAEWAAGIAAYFFTPAMRGRPALLSMDDDAAAAIRGDGPVAAVEDLIHAVRIKLRRREANPLEPFFKDYIDWRVRPESEPPFLPFLAVCVLAAAHMAQSDGVASNNYYARLRELLGMDLDGRPVPGYYDTLPDLWDGLRHWLDVINRGERGVSAVGEDPGGLVYIWPALSQAQLRKSDRQKLGAFFRFLHLEPGETVDGGELLRYFRVWAPTSNLSLGARRLVEREEGGIQLTQILLADLKAWDGRERDSTGRTVATLALALSFDHPIELRLVAEHPPHFPETLTAVSGSGRRVQLEPYTEGWYRPLPWTPSDAELRDGVRLLSAGTSFVLKGALVWPFRENPDLGQPLSCPVAPPAEPFSILAHESLRGDVERFLAAAAAPGWRSSAARGEVPVGWSIFTGVVIDRPPAVKPHPALTALMPAPGARISLWGGLPLPRGNSVYLSGGEPDIWIPSGLSGQELRVDGMAHPVAGGEERIPLRALSLGEGAHTVLAGPATRVFRTLSTTGKVEADRPEPVVHRLRRNGTRYESLGLSVMNGTEQPDEGNVWVEGVAVRGAPADVPGDPPLPVRLRAGATEYIVVGDRPGQFLHVSPKPAPGWVQRAGLAWNFIEEPVDFDPVWVFTRWPVTGLTVHAVRDTRPGVPLEGVPEQVRSWRDAFTIGWFPDDPATSDLWDSYIDAADAL